MLLAENALILARHHVVYCYHFSRPVSPFHTCQHYLGYADDLEARDAEHRAGTGARLTEVAVERGIELLLVWAIPGDRSLERRLKRWHNTPQLCPGCAGRHHPIILAQRLPPDLPERPQDLEDLEDLPF
ncbi:MAG: hypothetical protein OHK0022_21880 [Roseiflexaceae bacterium]